MSDNANEQAPDLSRSPSGRLPQKDLSLSALGRIQSGLPQSGDIEPAPIPPRPPGLETVTIPSADGSRMVTQPRGAIGLLEGLAAGLLDTKGNPLPQPNIKAPHERGNLDLLELYQQMAARVAMYNNEAQHKALFEIRAELERRLELRSPDLRDEATKVGTLTIDPKAWGRSLDWGRDMETTSKLPAGEYPLYIGRPARPDEASFEVQRLRNLLLKSHPHVPNKRCRAYEPREGDRSPGPSNPPMFCTQNEGHEGNHRNQHGTYLRPPFKFFSALPGYCRRCNAPWPCPTIREAGIVDHALESELRAGQGG